MNKIDYDELVAILEKAYHEGIISNTYLYNTRKALTQANANEGKFDVLKHLRDMPDLKDKYGNIWTRYADDSFHYIIKNGEGSVFLTVGELLTHFDSIEPYEPPTLEDQLIYGNQYAGHYSLNGNRFLSILTWRDGWTNEEGDKFSVEFHPKTDDNGKPIMCGPIKNEDV